MQKLTASTVFDFLRGKKLALIGLGVSHRPVARLLAQKQLEVTVYDKKSPEELGEAAAELAAMGVRFVTGADYLEQLGGDIIFRTPGMYYNHPRLHELMRQGAAVTSELELFLQCCPCPVIGVTGSDGKTTTTSRIAEMLRQGGKTVHLGGNIGRALFSEIERVQPDDVAVVELSSFQLLSMRQSPEIAVVTNVSPNHLDVHGTMEEYIAAKKNIFAHQTAFSATVLNADCAVTAGFAGEVRGECRWFSRRHPVERGAWMDGDGLLHYSAGGCDTPLFPAAEIRLPGLHNVENMLTAIAAVWGLVPPEEIRRVAAAFAGVEHRIEFVRELDGVKWYNDSIATSPTRTIAGLQAFSQKLILIAGGYDKHLDYTPLAEPMLRGVKTLILTGATADKIEAAVTGHPGYAASGMQIRRAADLEEAVHTARELARPGDIVSLSPASASFDRYPNFEVRGQHYKALVNALEPRGK